MRTILLLSLSVLMIAAPVRSQEKFTDSGQFGVDLGSAANDDLEGSSGGVRGSLRGGRTFSRFFELEGEWLVTDFQRNATQEGRSALLLNGVFGMRPRQDRVPRPRLVPYLSIGVGAGQASRGGAADEGPNESSLATKAAAGCCIFFGKRATQGLRLEASALRMRALEGNRDTTTAATLGYVARFRIP